MLAMVDCCTRSTVHEPHLNFCSLHQREQVGAEERAWDWGGLAAKEGANRTFDAHSARASFFPGSVT